MQLSQHDKDLIHEAAISVRNWLKKNAEMYIDVCPDTLACGCGIASAKLAKTLNDIGIKARICQNEYHAFLMVGDHVLDVTATQFRDFKHPVVLETVEDLRSRYPDLIFIGFWPWTVECSFDSPKEFISHQKANGWPDSQIILSSHME